MKMKSMVLLVVALGFGFVAMMGVRQAMSSKGPKIKTKRVLVAKEEIRPFTRIEALQVGFEERPVESLPEGVITEAGDYEGRAARGVIAQKQLITKSMLTEKGKFGVAHLIPEGMRVATVKVNTTQAHSGLVKMGDKIDILVTYKLYGEQRSKTKTVLEMIEVFSVDQQVAEQQKEDDGPEQRKLKIENLSVLVTPDQAARLSQAQAKGTLEMILRNPHDKTLANTNMLTDEDFENLDTSVGRDREVPQELQVAVAPPVVAEPVAPSPEPEPEPVVEEPATVEVVDVLPASPPWVITIYENDTVRTEEIHTLDAPALTPEPAVDPTSDTPPKSPAPAKAAAPVRSPNGPSATEPGTKTPPKTARASRAKTAGTSLGN